MKIVQLKNIKPNPVKNWSEIKENAREMQEMLIKGNFPGKWKDGLALSHCQVEGNDPKNFFVVHEKLSDNFNGFTVLCNALIVGATDMVDFREACLSYAHRPEIKTKRHLHIIVEADVHNPLKIFGSGLSRRTFTLVGLAAFIVQHEIDHAKGVDIYHKFKK